MKDDLQISLFDGEPAPGTWVEAHGELLSFDDLTHMIGDIVIKDCSTESHAWYKAVRVVSIIHTFDGDRRLVFSDRPTKRRGDYGSVSAQFFAPTCRHPVKFYLPAQPAEQEATV